MFGSHTNPLIFGVQKIFSITANCEIQQLELTGQVGWYKDGDTLVFFKEIDNILSFLTFENIKQRYSFCDRPVAILLSSRCCFSDATRVFT